MIIYLPAPVFLASSNQLDWFSEKLGLDGPPFSCRPRATIPEDKSGRLPFLCFVLHRMGFFVPRELLRKR